MLIEAFGLADNLMIEGAIFPVSSGGALFTAAVAAAARWTDLSAFERGALRRAATGRLIWIGADGCVFL